MSNNSEEDLYNATPEPVRRGHRRPATDVPSSPPETSDKENNQTYRTATEKGKGRAVTVARSSSGLSDSGTKRRRTEEHITDAGPLQRRRRTIEPADNEENDDDEGYDPDQDVHERRKLREGFRELHQTLTNNRAEYLKPDSDGINVILRKANDLVQDVKQTADATIDSRLLVTTADLSYKKTVQLTLGESSLGVDVDEFVAKCTSLMRRSAGYIWPEVTHDEDDKDENGDSLDHEVLKARAWLSRSDSPSLNVGEEHGDDGDMLQWHALGAAAVEHNFRPSMPGFLLGPLSAEKRSRKVVERKARSNFNDLKETKPTILTAGDIQKSENTNLTVLCGKILMQLNKTIEDGQAAVEAEATDEMDDVEVRRLMYKHGVLSTGGVDFFQFVINPYSFGQTVENMFYVSFLIRDGKVGIDFDDDMIPSLSMPARLLILLTANTLQTSQHHVVATM